MTSLNPMNNQQNNLSMIDSREVAEMISKRHNDLLRDIDGYVQILENAKLRSHNFFEESTYKVEGNNKTYKCYLLSRKGCEFVANKLTGEKGVLFTAQYIERFHEMEVVIAQQAAPQLSRQQMAEMLTIELNKEVDIVKTEVAEIKQVVSKRLTIDYREQSSLNNAKKKRVCELIDQAKSREGDFEPTEHYTTFSDYKSYLHRSIWRDFYKAFGVASYRDTLVKDFTEAINWLKVWRPLL